MRNRRWVGTLAGIGMASRGRAVVAVVSIDARSHADSDRDMAADESAWVHHDEDGWAGLPCGSVAMADPHLAEHRDH